MRNNGEGDGGVTWLLHGLRGGDKRPPAGTQPPGHNPTHALLAKTPWDPSLYLDSASCRQVAHVIEGSHLRLGLLLEVQLLTFNLDISSTWGQTETALTL